MKVYTSEWVVPVVSPPISKGAVAIEEGRIVAVGPAETIVARIEHLRGGFPPAPSPGAGHPGPARGDVGPARSDVIDLGNVVLLPAFVNAHTHLELSWMREEPLPRHDFMSWVRAMIGRRIAHAGEVEAAIGRAIETIVESGTALVGDVGNTTAALAPLRASHLAGRFFLEMIGPGKASADGLIAQAERMLHHFEAESAFPASIVPHGPHSVSVEMLGLISERAAARGDILSVHLAESAAEDDLVRRGDGPFRAILEELGSVAAAWRPPGVSPARHLDACGLLGPRTLAVHGVRLDREDARLLARRGATVVMCPRSNARLGVGNPPVHLLHEEGVRLALGTDSLASNDDLDLHAELRALRRLAPDLPPQALVRAATLAGAEALGMSCAFGSIEPGKTAALVVLRVSSRDPDGRPVPSTDGRSDAADAEPYATIFSDRSVVAALLVGDDGVAQS